MGFFSNPLSIIGAAVNPVSMLGTLGFTGLSGGFDYLSSEADRRSNEAMANSARSDQMAIAERNFAFQDALAKQGVRWRVEDAEAAGLHPLAALGMMPQGSSPVSVMSDFGGNRTSSSGNAFRAFSNMGQNLMRAAQAGATADERMLNQANVDKVRAETDYMKAMTAESLKRASMPGNPPLPDPYSGVSGGDVRVVPNMHQVMRGPNGYEVQWSDEYGRSMMARPFSMAGRDLYEVIADALGGTKRLWRNLISRNSRSQGELRGYKGGY